MEQCSTAEIQDAFLQQLGFGDVNLSGRLATSYQIDLIVI